MEDQHQDEIEGKTYHNLCDLVEVPHLRNYFLHFFGLDRHGRGGTSQQNVEHPGKRDCFVELSSNN